MSRKKNSYKIFLIILIFILGTSLGVIIIWPGIISGKNRNCFWNIIKDGSDGNVSLNTVLSISPKYLIKIKNASDKYQKVLFIGDYCFRK